MLVTAFRLPVGAFCSGGVSRHRAMTIPALLQLPCGIQPYLVGLAPHLIGVIGQRPHATDAFLVSTGHVDIVNSFTKSVPRKMRIDERRNTVSGRQRGCGTLAALPWRSDRR